MSAGDVPELDGMQVAARDKHAASGGKTLARRHTLQWFVKMK
jgi:hypothetical protein